MSSVFCPTCDRDDFESERGVKLHHAKSHGESLAKNDRKCNWCESSFRAYRTTDRKYCGESCSNKAHSNRLEGKGNPNWKGGQGTIECSYCGECYELSRREINERDGFIIYCRKCKSDYLKENYQGENHPSWDGGDWKRTKYGKNWQGPNGQRMKALRRDDFECQVCSMDNETHKELFGGKSLHVHHIEKRTNFIEGGEFDYERANRLNNLITLCSEHHKEVEKETLVIQNE